MWRSNQLVILAVILFCVGIFCLAQSRADMPMTGVGEGAPSSHLPSCTASTNFLARTSLTGSDVVNYQDLICGLVNDGVITGNLSGATGCGTYFDLLYIFATADSTTALLNLCGTSYSGTAVASPTFTAYSGYNSTDSASTCPYINTNYTASTNGVAMTLNAGHSSLWNFTNTTPTNGFSDMGAFANGNTLIETSPAASDGTAAFRTNDIAGTVAISTKIGHFISNRTDSTHSQAYLNGSLFHTINATSVALPNIGISILGRDDAGTTEVCTGHQLGMASVGNDLVTPGLAGAFYSRLRTYMTAVGH